MKLASPSRSAPPGWLRIRSSSLLHTLRSAPSSAFRQSDSIVLLASVQDSWLHSHRLPHSSWRWLRSPWLLLSLAGLVALSQPTVPSPELSVVPSSWPCSRQQPAELASELQAAVKVEVALPRAILAPRVANVEASTSRSAEARRWERRAIPSVPLAATTAWMESCSKRWHSNDRKAETIQRRPRMSTKSAKVRFPGCGQATGSPIEVAPCSPTLRPTNRAVSNLLLELCVASFSMTTRRSTRMMVTWKRPSHCHRGSLPSSCSPSSWHDASWCRHLTALGVARNLHSVEQPLTT